MLRKRIVAAVVAAGRYLALGCGVSLG